MGVGVAVAVAVAVAVGGGCRRGCRGGGSRGRRSGSGRRRRSGSVRRGGCRRSGGSRGRRRRRPRCGDRAEARRGRRPSPSEWALRSRRGTRRRRGSGSGRRSGRRSRRCGDSGCRCGRGGGRRRRRDRRRAGRRRIGERRLVRWLPASPAASGVGVAAARSAKANGSSSSTVTSVNSGDTRMYPTTARTTATIGVAMAATGSRCRHTHRCQPTRYPKAPSRRKRNEHRRRRCTTCTGTGPPLISPGLQRIHPSWSPSAPLMVSQESATPLRGTPRYRLDEFGRRGVPSTTCQTARTGARHRFRPGARLVASLPFTL